MLFSARLSLAAATARICLRIKASDQAPFPALAIAPAHGLLAGDCRPALAMDGKPLFDGARSVAGPPQAFVKNLKCADSVLQPVKFVITNHSIAVSAGTSSVKLVSSVPPIKAGSRRPRT